MGHVGTVAWSPECTSGSDSAYCRQAAGGGTLPPIGRRPWSRRAVRGLERSLVGLVAKPPDPCLPRQMLPLAFFGSAEERVSGPISGGLGQRGDEAAAGARGGCRTVRSVESG